MRLRLSAFVAVPIGGRTTADRPNHRSLDLDGLFDRHVVYAWPRQLPPWDGLDASRHRQAIPGRTDDQKERLAEAVARSAAEMTGCSLTSVSVAVEEVDSDAWAGTVYRLEIIETAVGPVQVAGYNPSKA